MRRFIEQRPQQIDKREQEEQESRGAVTIPYLKGCLSSSGELLTDTLFELLSSLDHVETWKPVLNSFFDREKDCSRK